MDIWYERDIISHDGAYVFHVDIFLDNYDIVIEVDGLKNHGTKRKKAKDRWRTSELEKVGLKVLRITVDEALGAPEQIIPILDRLTGRNKKNRLF